VTMILPPELLEDIFTFFNPLSDSPTLRICLLTSPDLLTPSRRALYSCIKLSRIRPRALHQWTCAQFYELLCEVPSIGTFTKEIIVSPGLTGHWDTWNRFPDVVKRLANPIRISVQGLHWDRAPPFFKDSLKSLIGHPSITSLSLSTIYFTGLPHHFYSEIFEDCGPQLREVSISDNGHMQEVYPESQDYDPALATEIFSRKGISPEHLTLKMNTNASKTFLAMLCNKETPMNVKNLRSLSVLMQFKLIVPPLQRVLRATKGSLRDLEIVWKLPTIRSASRFLSS
jgi:hypothetical protein